MYRTGYCMGTLVAHSLSYIYSNLLYDDAVNVCMQDYSIISADLKHNALVAPARRSAAPRSQEIKVSPTSIV